MLALVVLGNRMKDDGNLSETAILRLETTLQAIELFKPDYVILSGGLANPIAGITEAAAMKDYLLRQGVNPDKLITEEESISTLQNAKFTVSLARQRKIDDLVIITTPEHLARGWLNPLKLFSSEINDRKDIRLSAYTSGLI